MERTVTILDSRTQKKHVFKSFAETLGELKADLRELGVPDLTDMVFKEGTTRAEYSENSAILPTEVLFKGRPTNDLAFMIIQPKKKIMSGMNFSELSRSELYELIQNNQLQDLVLELCNENYTRVPNTRLREVVEDYFNSLDDIESNEDYEVSEITLGTLAESFGILVNYLHKEGYISHVAYDEIFFHLASNNSNNESSIYDDETLFEMFQ